MARSKWKIDDEGRECTGCGVYKEWEEFNMAKKGSHGKTAICKDCTSKQGKEYQKNNSKRIQLRKAKYYNENTEKVKGIQKKSRERNKDTMKATREKNKDQIHANAAEYYLNNREDLKAKSRKYYYDNVEKVAEYARNRRKTKEFKENRNKYNRDRKANDQDFKMRAVLRNRIYEVLKAGNARTNFKSYELLGCSPSECITYLEATSKEKLLFKDHGYFGNHIDHIIPCTYFDLSDPIEQHMCFNYRNLQLLNWNDNLTKNNVLPNFEELKERMFKLFLAVVEEKPYGEGH